MHDFLCFKDKLVFEKSKSNMLQCANKIINPNRPLSQWLNEIILAVQSKGSELKVLGASVHI